MLLERLNGVGERLPFKQRRRQALITLLIALAISRSAAMVAPYSQAHPSGD